MTPAKKARCVVIEVIPGLVIEELQHGEDIKAFLHPHTPTRAHDCRKCGAPVAANDPTCSYCRTPQ